MTSENKYQKNEIIKWGIAAGFLESVYVFLAVLILNTLSGKQVDNNPVIGGLFMLLFFILSVLISGVLVLGRPTMLVLNKKITEAVATFFISLGTIFVIFLVVFWVVII